VAGGLLTEKDGVRPMTLTGYQNIELELIPKLKELAPLFYRYLCNHTDYDNPIKSKYLEKMFDVVGVQVRLMVSWLRLHEKKPIGSDGRGYFIAKSSEELETTKAHMRERGYKDLAVADALDCCFEEIG
jgi:hypothetical protein